MANSSRTGGLKFLVRLGQPLGLLGVGRADGLVANPQTELVLEFVVDLSFDLRGHPVADVCANLAQQQVLLHLAQIGPHVFKGLGAELVAEFVELLVQESVEVDRLVPFGEMLIDVFAGLRQELLLVALLRADRPRVVPSRPWPARRAFPWWLPGGPLSPLPRAAAAADKRRR